MLACKGLLFSGGAGLFILVLVFMKGSAENVWVEASELAVVCFGCVVVGF